MTRFFVPALLAAIVFSSPSVSQAQFYFDWGFGLGYPSYYSTYYSPGYSTYYSPSYYSASYVPAASYYGPSACCDSGCCRTSYSIVSDCCSTCGSACCSPCNLCGRCGDCCDGNCELASSQGAGGVETPVQPRPDNVGSGRTPTFIEEQDRGAGGGNGSGYENQGGSQGDGFSPRDPGDQNNPSDPLDQNFNTSTSTTREHEVLKFETPSTMIRNESDSQSDGNEDSVPALINLDDKITTRTPAIRTRLVRRQSWTPVQVARRVPATGNADWVPAPAQLAQK